MNLLDQVWGTDRVVAGSVSSASRVLARPLRQVKTLNVEVLTARPYQGGRVPGSVCWSVWQVSFGVMAELPFGVLGARRWDTHGSASLIESFAPNEAEGGVDSRMGPRNMGGEIETCRLAPVQRGGLRPWRGACSSVGVGGQ